FNLDRAQKIVVEAAEQSGRSDVPKILPVKNLVNVLGEYKNKIQLIICDERGESLDHSKFSNNRPTGVVVGPEGGWSNAENNLFDSNQLPIFKLNSNNFTLRAETAAIACVAKVY